MPPDLIGVHFHSPMQISMLQSWAWFIIPQWLTLLYQPALSSTWTILSYDTQILTKTDTGVNPRFKTVVITTAQYSSRTPHLSQNLSEFIQWDKIILESELAYIDVASLIMDKRVLEDSQMDWAERNDKIRTIFSAPDCNFFESFLSEEFSTIWYLRCAKKKWFFSQKI